MKEKDDPPADIPKYLLKRRLRDKKRQRPTSYARKTAYARELKKLNVHKPVHATSKRDLETMLHLKALLKNTWAEIFENADNYSHFSKKQLEFFRRYAINGRKNKVSAMKAAGYDYADPKNADYNASLMLRQPYADELIRAFEFEEKAKMGLMVEDVVKWFQDIATAAMESGDYTNANRAMENLGKYLQMFTDRKEIIHRVVQSKEELDARIQELQAVLNEERPSIASKLRIN